MSLSALGSQNLKQVISEYRSSPSFQQVYRVYQDQIREKKNVFKRMWNAVKEAILPLSPTYEYDLFTWWWVKECLADPSLDPTGLIARELLTNASGFGGWSNPLLNPDGVEVDQLKLYVSAAFLFYWHHPDMPKPTKGPVVLQRVWKAAQDKQSLWIEPHFVDPSSLDEWLKNITPDGWNPGDTPLDEAIVRKFECTQAFDKVMGPKWLGFYGDVESLEIWLGVKPYHTFFELFEAVRLALKNDDISIEQQQQWLKNLMTLNKLLSVSDVMGFLKQNDASYLGCLNMLMAAGEVIRAEDTLGFRQFLGTFDPQTVDIEKNWAYVKWLNITLFSGFHHRWNAICGDKEKKLDADGATNPILIFKLLYDEEAGRGLWPAVKNETFPYIPIFLSLTTHGDIDTQSPVYKAALVRTLRRGYDLHSVSSLQNFLWDYLNSINDAPEAVRTRCVAVEACTIEERDIQVGDVWDVADVEKLDPLHQGMFERQEVCVHPYNIWRDANPDAVQQRISMAIDFLFAESIWPQDYARGLLEKKHKLAMMLLMHQRMIANKAKEPQHDILR